MQSFHHSRQFLCASLKSVPNLPSFLLNPAYFLGTTDPPSTVAFPVAGPATGAAGRVLLSQKLCRLVEMLKWWIYYNGGDAMMADDF